MSDRTALVWAAVTALLLTHCLLCTLSIRGKSIAYDEICHVTRAVSFVKTGDYRLDPTQGPLVPHWVGLPLRFLDIRFPSLDQPDWKRSNVWKLGRQLFDDPTLGNGVPRMLFWGRFMITLLSAALGLAVFLWSRRLFGTAGAMLSLVFYAFSPTMIAHGQLVTIDLAAALFFVLAMAAMWRWTHRVTIGTTVMAVLAVGGLFLTKFSALLLGPMWVVMVIVRVCSRRPIRVGRPGISKSLTPARVIRVRRTPRAKLAAFAGLSLLLLFTTGVIIWAAYGFRWLPFKDGATDPAGYRRDALAGRYDYDARPSPAAGETAWDAALHGMGRQAAAWRWLHESCLLPDAYVQGCLVLLRSARARDAFLCGERSVCGWPWFFPYAFLVKTPTPLLAMLVIACAPWWWRWRRRAANGAQRRSKQSRLDAPSILEGFTHADGCNPHPGPLPKRERERERRGCFWFAGLYRTAPLWILIAVYGVASVRSHINIGHRHLLPIYPAVFILIGAAGGWLRMRRRWMRIVPGVMALLFAAASVSAYPHYLAYFNQLIGGPANGYKHLVDSSLDWGQDLGGLAAWLHDMRGRRPEPVYLEYFGTASPHRAGIVARRLIPRWPRDADVDLALGGGTYCISATSLQQVYLYGEAEAKAGLPRTAEWTPRHEQTYQSLLPAMQRFEQLPRNTAARERFLSTWRADYAEQMGLFYRLRFMRLCVRLRERTPDAQIGYSIMVYFLSDRDAREACGYNSEASARGPGSAREHGSARESGSARGPAQTTPSPP